MIGHKTYELGDVIESFRSIKVKRTLGEQE